MKFCQAFDKRKAETEAAATAIEPLFGLAENFEDAADDGVEETWSEEIKRRVDEIRLGKVKMVPGEEMRRWFSERLRDAKK